MGKSERLPVFRCFRRNHWIKNLWHDITCSTLFNHVHPRNPIKNIPEKYWHHISPRTGLTPVVGHGTHWCAPTSVRPGHPGVEPTPASPRFGWDSADGHVIWMAYEWLENGWNNSLWWFNHDDICMFDIGFYLIMITYVCLIFWNYPDAWWTLKLSRINTY